MSLIRKLIDRLRSKRAAKQAAPAPVPVITAKTASPIKPAPRNIKPIERPSNPAPTDHFVSQITAIAASQVGIRETSHNQGPGIQKFWVATSYGVSGYHDRQPWCAAFLAWVVREAALQTYHVPQSIPFRLPRSAAVNDWPAWADGVRGHWQRIPLSSNIKTGDIICWDFNGRDEPGGTHIGLAVSNEDSAGNYRTIEGNTNAAGSREGNGVWEKTRSRKGIFAIIRHLQ